MKVIGLTGGIASGKTTVARMLEAHGGAIIDADIAAREVVAPGEPALAEIAEAFGPEVLGPDGGLNRPVLAGIIFRDEAARQKLNAIVHPRVRARMFAQLDALRRQPEPPRFAVLVVPLLLESGHDWAIDQVWVVSVPEEVQLERLMRRDQLASEAAQARIRAQMSLSEKLRHADRVIENNGHPSDVEKAVVALLRSEQLL
ncbi:Dephospho-CoA kinase [compost metagenome]